MLSSPSGEHPRDASDRRSDASSADGSREFYVLMRALLTFFCIGFGVWLVFTWKGYGSRYAQATETWRLGDTRMVEVTLVREDAQRLACASDLSFDGLHCGYRSDGRDYAPPPQDDRQVLRPYVTVDRELFLASGLWSAPALSGPLPGERFTVVCNFHMVGVTKSVSLRWAPVGRFDPATKTLAAGSLSDCVIPR